MSERISYEVYTFFLYKETFYLKLFLYKETFYPKIFLCKETFCKFAVERIIEKPQDGNIIVVIQQKARRY